ncbi:MAG: MotA/TolQ/ExbB proton channel family protein [Verrucomicrobiota bacterium]
MVFRKIGQWLLACSFATILLSSALMAQEAVAADGAKPHDKKFSDVFKEGGPVMYFCVAMSMCVVAFTVEGFVKLRLAKLAPPMLVAQLKEHINSGNYQEAWQLCQTAPSYLSTVLSAGLERVGRSKEAVDFAVQETAVTEATILKTNTTYLSVIGVISPMVGLTGTVTGMIKAFATLGQSGISDPSKLAANIGEVLVATAAGLVVAIPAFIFFYVLKGKAQTACLRADSVVYRLLEDIPYDQLQGIRIGEYGSEIFTEQEVPQA